MEGGQPEVWTARARGRRGRERGQMTIRMHVPGRGFIGGFGIEEVVEAGHERGMGERSGGGGKAGRGEERRWEESVGVTGERKRQE